MTKITTRPLDLQALFDEVRDPAHGGQASFVGTVRDNHEGHKVLAVSYEAFEPLAEKILADIAREAGRRHNATVAAAHRLGKLAVGEASVAVAASSMHRAEAFAACREVIEEIKKRLPVWKKEHYEGGESSWLSGCALSATPA
jgi:molybdopterin synthase catalytic subunit